VPVGAAEAEQAGYGRFPERIERDWLGRWCHLSEADISLARRRTGDVTRLGFAVQLTSIVQDPARILVAGPMGRALGQAILDDEQLEDMSALLSALAALGAPHFKYLALIEQEATQSPLAMTVVREPYNSALQSQGLVIRGSIAGGGTWPAELTPFGKTLLQYVRDAQAGDLSQWGRGRTDATGPRSTDEHVDFDQTPGQRSTATSSVVPFICYQRPGPPLPTFSCP
jgi:hypothetical protein